MRLLRLRMTLGPQSLGRRQAARAGGRACWRRSSSLPSCGARRRAGPGGPRPRPGRQAAGRSAARWPRSSGWRCGSTKRAGPTPRCRPASCSGRSRRPGRRRGGSAACASGSVPGPRIVVAPKLVGESRAHRADPPDAGRRRHRDGRRNPRRGLPAGRRRRAGSAAGHADVGGAAARQPRRGPRQLCHARPHRRQRRSRRGSASRAAASASSIVAPAVGARHPARRRDPPDAGRRLPGASGRRDLARGQPSERPARAVDSVGRLRRSRRATSPRPSAAAPT